MTLRAAGLGSIERVPVAAALCLAMALFGSPGCVEPPTPLQDAGAGGGGGAGGCPGECTSPPASFCSDATTVEAFASVGRCLLDGGCEYTPVSVACTTSCADGACEGEACATVFCDAPPPATCDDATHLRVFSAPGLCTDGTCSYGSTVAECPSGCSMGVCGGDRCLGTTCNAPPAAMCVSASSLRTFVSPGTCTAATGLCSYQPSDSPCTYGCSGGACLQDPCAGRTCNQPPVSTCTNATTLHTFASPGACNPTSGSCEYVGTDTPCPASQECQSGQCQTPSPTCTSSNCAAGCCDGPTCITPASQTNLKCGTSAQACGACGSGYTCQTASCQDVNECATNNGGCHVNATCANTAGGRTCTCKPGYQGTGISCTPQPDAGVDAGTPDAGGSTDAGSPDAGGVVDAGPIDREWAQWPIPSISPPSSQFVLTATTATDTVTGLTWQRANSAGAYTWAAATAHCANLSLGGFSDWRLPTLIELHSITDYTRSPCYDPTVFTTIALADQWTSTPATPTNMTAIQTVGASSCFSGLNAATASRVMRCVR